MEQTAITVTDAAASKIRQLLDKQGTPEHGLRLGVAGGGCSGLKYRLAFEGAAGELDQVIQANGVTVFVDPNSSPYLEGVQVDYVDGLMGAGFKVENPNARSTCRCGESFCS